MYIFLFLKLESPKTCVQAKYNVNYSLLKPAGPKARKTTCTFRSISAKAQTHHTQSAYSLFLKRENPKTLRALVYLS